MNTAFLNTLPITPGVYLFKDPTGTILYIGKAKSIRTRVKSYFNNYYTDWKIDNLIKEHAKVDYIGTKNETEALLLEAQLIAQHKPKYNVLLKSGQPFVYILFTAHTPSSPSVIKIVRNKKLKGCYFGPFLHKNHARGVYRYLMQTFKLFLCNKTIANGCLDYHIGICAGNCMQQFDTQDYLFRLDLARAALKSNHDLFLENIKTKIAEYNRELVFEKSQQLNNYLENFDTIFTTIATRYSPTKYEDAINTVTTPRLQPVDSAINYQLQQFLQIDTPIKTIDCFDISHFQSSYLVGSCVRFTDGKPDKNSFRRFKIKTLSEQNDYAALQEIVTRRYKHEDDIPDLVLIDGGKGQLSAVRRIIPQARCISLAKREETIFGAQFPDGIKLDLQTDVGRLLIALRDYTHHFAITYHRKLRSSSAPF
ncbi:MAG TPA: GIY-YIG nuclease family protein [Candidatus Babeliales bacterium]|nr:GIY-YIG nuclease family protein [Candidatus Babeliales bacterium]